MAIPMRSAALRLPIRSAPRQLSLRLAPSFNAIRANSSTPSVPAPQGEFQEESILNREVEGANFQALNDDKIPHGVEAFVVMPGKLANNAFNASRRAVEVHALHTTDLWRRISFYIALPGCLVTALWVYYGEKEHAEHRQHMIDENGGEMPERKVYSYMNIRTKPFPWGNQSLFFNPEYNIKVEEP